MIVSCLSLSLSCVKAIAMRRKRICKNGLDRRYVLPPHRRRKKSMCTQLIFNKNNLSTTFAIAIEGLD